MKILAIILFIQFYHTLKVAGSSNELVQTVSHRKSKCPELLPDDDDDDDDDEIDEKKINNCTNGQCVSESSTMGTSTTERTIKTYYVRDCAEANVQEEFVYFFQPEGEKSKYLSRCLIGCEEDPKPWTLLLVRSGGILNFQRNLKEYYIGFGNPFNEYWLGLRQLNYLTKQGKYELLIRIAGDNCIKTSYFDEFVVGDRKEQFIIKKMQLSDTNELGFKDLTGNIFSEKKPNVSLPQECVQRLKGGRWWWFASENENCDQLGVPTLQTETELMYSYADCNGTEIIMAIRTTKAMPAYPNMESCF